MKITTHNFMLILCQIPFTNLFSCVLLKEPCGIFEVANIVLVSRLDISKWVIRFKLGFLGGAVWNIQIGDHCSHCCAFRLK